MKRLVIVVMLMLGGVFTVAAQEEALPIVYNEPVNAELTIDQDAALFSFTGSAGDVVLVELVNQALASAFYPIVEVQDDNGAELAEAGGLLNTNTEALQLGTTPDNLNATLVVELPEDGDYRIVVMADDFVELVADANFRLSLLPLQAMESGDEVEGTITSERGTYYLMQPEGAFSLAYTRTEGDLYPQVTVNRLEDGRLIPVAVISGNDVVSGSVGIGGGESSYIVVVKKAGLDLQLSPTVEEATYTLIYRQEG